MNARIAARINARALRATTDGVRSYNAGSTVRLYLSDARYVTRPDDKISHRPHTTGLVDSVNLELAAWTTVAAGESGKGFPRAVGRAGGIEGVLSISWAEELGWYKDLAFDGAQVEIRRIRIRQSASGATTQDLWEDGELLRLAQIRGRPERTDQLITWAVVDPIDLALEQDLATGKYLGLGSRWETDGVGDYAEIAHDAGWAPAGDFTLEVNLCRLGTAASARAWLMKDVTHAAPPFGLINNTGGNMTARITTSAGTYNLTVGAARPLGVDTWVTLVFRGTESELYFDGESVGLRDGITGTLNTNAAALWLARTDTGGGRYSTAGYSHLRLWHRALTAAEVADLANRQLTEAEQADADLKLDIPFNDGYLEWGSERVGGYSAVLTGGTWGVTGEGAPDLAGAPKPATIGERHAIEPVHLGTVGSGAWYAGSWRSMLQWIFVYSDGVPLTPTLTKTGTFTFDSATRVISTAATEGLLGFVPDQEVTVSKTTSNNSTFTVAQIVGPKKIRVVEALVDETSGPVDIVSVNPAWEVDALRPWIIRLNNPPAGALRAYVRGDDGGALGYVSHVDDVLTMIATELSTLDAPTIDLGDAGEYLCGLHAGATRSTVGDALARIAECAHGTTWADGDGMRATRLEPDPSLWVSLGDWTRGQIDFVEEIPQDAPPSRVEIGHTPTDAELPEGSIAALAWSYLTDFARRPYRLSVADVADASIWPSARPAPVIPTELSGEVGAAELAADVAAFSAGRLWRIALRGDAGRTLEPGQVWTYYYGTAASSWKQTGWETGRAALTVGIERVIADGKLEVVVWTPDD